MGPFIRFLGSALKYYPVKQQIYNILSTLAILASFLPMLIVVIKKLWRSQPFLLFACYWALGGLVNLVDKIPGIGPRQLEYITVIYNMFDVPMVLAILYVCSTSAGVKKLTGIAAPGFLVIEMIKGKPLGDKFMEKAQIVGFVILVALMVFVLGNDILKYVIK